MEKMLYELFSSLNIEYFAVLDYKVCRVISENIIDREGFAPKSVIIYLLPYYTGECVNISRYAASLDYHIAIRETNDKIGALIKEKFPDGSYKGYGDHSPIDERHAALIGGLGCVGENGLLINEKYGSYIFVGDMITDIPPEKLGAKAPVPYGKCIGCGSCKTACPTGILRGAGEECLSAITQRKGILSDEEAELMRKYNTVWGCDICQSVCPHNKNPQKTPIPFFYRERISELTEELLSGLNKEALRSRAFGWRGRAVVERNLALFKK